ncbi:MAG: nucleotide exchange factor GrpE [Gammaproteobacteria bacterium]|nr:nucleotide exchange factor GrpE [Gammaproteobacteria bacterium]MDH5308739.1 nucleotide exchange factor GrpE [Gammaproteobacteria bacterium]
MTGKPERDANAQTTEMPENGSAAEAAAEAGVAGNAQGETPQDLVAAAEARAAENWDKYLRAVAELDNYRKRAARDLENAHKFAVERFAREILAVSDSLELGIAAGAEADSGVMLDGMLATLKLLQQTLEQFGIAVVDPLGEPFDPEFHEAMTMQPSADAEPGSVLTVFQKGYTLNGRLLRPARVVVARAPAEQGGGGTDGA